MGLGMIAMSRSAMGYIAMLALLAASAVPATAALAQPRTASSAERNSKPQPVSSNGIYPSAAQLLQAYPNPSWSLFPRSGHDVVELAPGLYTFRYGRQAVRNIFMVTPRGVIVTDPINAKAAAILREEIRRITPLPVRFVVYSHNHWDHVSGGQIFKDEGATFIAQRNCVAGLKARLPHDVVMPDIVYDDRYTVRLGGRTLELYHFGADAGVCNSYMRPDGGELMVVVDTVIPGRTPVGAMADTDPGGIIRSLRRLEAMPISAIIPGHGTPIAGKSALTERRLYMEALMKATQERLADPSPPLDLYKSITVPQFSYLRGYSEDIAKNAERMVNYFYIGW